MTGVLSKNIKNTILIFLLAVNTNIVFATVHQIQVWNGYYQFLPPSNLTVNLGDTIQWVPLDPPTMYHSITSYNIPIGATSFDEPWQLPSDTFFQYIPQIPGLYQYHCTPHISFGMLGEFTVISNNYPQTYVPDDNFEAFLENNGMGNGIQNDDSVTTSSINTQTQLYINNQNIIDLTGIQDFDSLRTLDCNFNPGLLNLDLSNNTALLYVSANQIFGTQSGGLANINVSGCTKLQFLTCIYSQITNIDINNCPDLIVFNAGHNLIDSIDLSNNTLLETIILDNNLISEVDVTNNSNINVLDISDNPNLQCAEIRNGNNIYISSFLSTGNPNLYCINVDDSTYSTNNWTNISPQNYFSSNCSLSCANDTFNCADSIQITDVTIIPATQTISIGIYNGYNSFLNYPYVLCTLDANGDTLHTGALNSFGAFGLDTSWYTYSTINSSLPVLPISVYFVYTGWTFLTDTCILTFNDFTTNTVEYLVNQKKEILKITDFNGKETHPATNTPLIYMYKNGLVEKRMILE